MLRIWILVVTHGFALFAGFAAGIYLLPILTAPEGPTPDETAVAVAQANFEGMFRRDLSGSDFLHWGEGTVVVGDDYIALQGELAPGPDYKLYLAPGFVETEAEFLELRPEIVRVGDVRTFRNFVVPVPDSVDPSRYNTVVVWCESFGEFITAAEYR